MQFEEVKTICGGHIIVISLVRYSKFATATQRSHDFTHAAAHPLLPKISGGRWDILPQVS